MKILIVTPSYKPAFVYGGPIFSVAYLAEELTKQNEVLVISTTANGLEELDFPINEVQNINGVSVRFFSRQTKDHSHLSFGLLSYLWKNGGDYDIIHIQSWWNLVALFSALICKIKNWKYVITPRGMLSPYTYQSSLVKKLIHLFLGNNLLKRAVIHATASDEAVKIENLNIKYNIQVAPNYVSVDIPFMERIQNQIPQLLFLSRIHPKKGLDILIKSLKLLPIDVKLNIVGDGDAEYIDTLKKIALSNQVQDKIIWHGSIYDDAKYNMYASCDLMILPSHDENFANNVLESLLLGTPVVVSENVGLAIFVKNNNLGWVFKGGELQLADAITKALNDKDRREKINTSARAIVLQEFNHNVLTEKYLTIYKNA